MIMLLALLAAPAIAGDAAAPDHGTRWQRIVSAAHAMEVSSNTLHQALNAPTRTSHARRTPRYCFDTASIDPDAPHMVCRTAPEWRALGLEPVIG